MTSIPHKSLQRKPDLTPDQWAQYDQLRADGLSLTKAAAVMGLSQATLSRRVEARLHPSNGTPTTALQRVDIPGETSSAPPAHHSALERISALPAHSDASAVDDLKARVATLEAFIGAMQQAQQRITVSPAHSSALERITEALAQLDTRLQAVESLTTAQPPLSALPAHQSASAHPIASQRTEPPTWVSRGMHVSTDVLASIDAYAARYRLEKREVLDRIVHTFFAELERTVADA